MKWKRHFRPLLLLVLLAAFCASPAYALEYSFDESDGPNYGKPTSVEVVQSADSMPKNEDRSKNAALIPPGFGSASSNMLGSGSYLTPDLVPSAMAGGAMVNGSFVTVLPPSLGGTSVFADTSAVVPPAGVTIIPGSSEVLMDVPTSVSPDYTASAISSYAAPISSGYTEVTSDLYYSNGSLGTLSIPAIGLTVGIYQGTDAATLKKGAGHFEDSSIWDGNVGLAAHNRGANDYFGEIHTLSLGDAITLTTALGTRTYAVTSVTKVDETDSSGLAASGGDMITLYTCVRDERDFRWCVQAQAI